MIKMTIIVPFYNSEQYMDKCIKSVLNQDIQDVQYIFVNDGGTDNSVNIVKKYMATDSRIELLEQNNRGQGAARNSALDISKGEYILFLDSDDYLSDNVLENLYRNAKDNKLDILRAKFRCTRNGENIPVDNSDMEGVVESGRSRLMRGRVSYSLCENIYRLAFLNEHSLRLPEGCRFEDMEFVTKATWYAARMMDRDIEFYNYMMHDTGSVSTETSEAAIKDYHYIAGRIAEFVEKEVDDEAYEAYFRDYLGFLYSHVINLCAKGKYAFYNLFDKDAEKNILNHLKKAKSKRYHVQYYLIKNNLFGLYSIFYGMSHK